MHRVKGRYKAVVQGYIYMYDDSEHNYEHVCMCDNNTSANTDNASTSKTFMQVCTTLLK